MDIGTKRKVGGTGPEKENGFKIINSGRFEFTKSTVQNTNKQIYRQKRKKQNKTEKLQWDLYFETPPLKEHFSRSRPAKRSYNL